MVVCSFEGEYDCSIFLIDSDVSAALEEEFDCICVTEITSSVGRGSIYIFLPLSPTPLPCQ